MSIDQSIVSDISVSSEVEELLSDVINQQALLTAPYYERIFGKKLNEMTQADRNTPEFNLLRAAGYFSVVWRDLIMAAAAEQGDERDDNVQHAAKEMVHAFAFLNEAGYQFSGERE